MSLWQDILKIAIVGIERNALALPARSDALGEVLSKLDANARASSLLSAAAAVALYDRAGQLPAKDSQLLPPPTEVDDRPSCTARAAQHLSRMLNGEYREMLLEWLTALAAARQRVPDDRLPAALDFCRANAAYRQAMIKVMGKRGAWLAPQNPNWKYAVGEADDTVWELGSFAARLHWVETLRATDPAKAAEVLRTSWHENSPKERVEFLLLLQNGLSLADEALLEFALDDRSTIVRRTAADLLGALPQSAFVQRMIERVRPLISFRQQGRKKPFVEVTLPAERTEDMIRDGITAKSQSSNIGEKTWWLSLMLGAVPFAFWQEHSGLSREELLQAVRKTEWEELFLEAWLRGGFNLGDIPLIEAILSQRPADHSLANLAQEITNAERDALLIALLESAHRDKLTAALGWILVLHQSVWSERLSTMVLAQWEILFAHLLKRHSYQITMPAIYLNAALIPQAIARLSAGKPVENVTEQLLNILQFRAEMLKEITT